MKQQLEWVLNDMRYCAPELAAEKMSLWYAKIQEALTESSNAPQGWQQGAAELVDALQACVNYMKDDSGGYEVYRATLDPAEALLKRHQEGK